jgi:membrane protein
MSIAAARARAHDALAGLRARHEWADHLVRALLRYHERHGNHLAAAITFFSILNAVPLLMLALAAAAYLLSFHPALLAALEASITSAVPAELTDTVGPVIEAAVEQRNTVAGVGLVAALWAGTWWMSNLREAVSAQWAIPPRNPASLQRLLSDLLALVGLWVALFGSVAITVIGTGLGETVLRLVGWQGAGWTQLTRISLGLLLGLVTDWLIFFWIITRLPRTHDRVRGAARAALLGAVGLEVLRQGLTVYLGRITGSAGGAVFGSLLGLLVFAYLVSRFVLLVTAWAATVAGNPAPEPAVAPPVPRIAPAPPRGPGTGVAAAMAAAMVVGVVVGTRLHHTRRGSR